MTWLPDPNPSAVALVTGASAGIGAAIARELAGRGHGVALVARREERLSRLAEELTNEYGIRAEIFPCDLADSATREELPDRIAAKGLRVEVLVNNAGVGSFCWFAESDPASQLQQVRVMNEAAVALCSAFTPAMAARRSGAVLNVSSGLGFSPIPGYATYSACKSFLIAFGDALHTELRRGGVAVTTLCPGVVESEFFDANGPQPVTKLMPSALWQSPEAVARGGIEGLVRNRRVIVPGARLRLLLASGGWVPAGLRLKVADRLLRSIEQMPVASMRS